MLIGMALAMIFGGLAMMGDGEILGGAFLAMFGGGIPVLIAALMVRRVRLTLDRSSGQLTRTMRSVRGLSTESHPLGRLKTASVGVSYDSDGNTYRTELQLADPPQTVPFTSYYTSGNKPEAMARAVNDWLGNADHSARL
ncbi:hypothetical protein [Aphanothece microscopica]|uniref:hypothetical protein n=1 Tax=Aphanothece microscopica TaxID=1049561 RepID=UPI003CE4FC9A